MHRIGESVLPGTYMADLVNLLPWCMCAFDFMILTLARHIFLDLPLFFA